jgi:hypothetical protein
MFWNKKKTVDDAKVMRAFEITEGLLQTILRDAHAKHLSHLTIIGDTAFNGIVFGVLYSAFSMSELAKLEDASDRFNRYLLSYFAIRNAVDPSSTRGAEIIRSDFMVFHVALNMREELLKNNVPGHFFLNWIRKYTYEMYNPNVSFPEAYEAAVADAGPRTLTAAIELLNRSLK